MNRHDIDKLVRWAINVTPMQFAEDAYGVTGTTYTITSEYISEKYSMMHENFMMWLGGLDSKNRARLARNITFHSENIDYNNPTKTDINEIGVEATKIIMRKKGE